MIGGEAAILEWLEGREASLIRRNDLTEGENSLVAVLHQNGLELLARKIEIIAASEGAVEVGIGGEAALACALADYAAQIPDHERFEVVRQLLPCGKSSWDLFQLRMVERLTADPCAFDALKERLAAEPTLLETAPVTVAMHSDTSPAILAEHHRSEAAVREMWESTWNWLYMRSTIEHEIVRRTDPAAWIIILESHTFPAPILSLIEGSTFDTVKELIPLLSASAPAFDEQGRWLSKQIAVFPLIAAASRLLQRLAGLGQNAQDLTTPRSQPRLTRSCPSLPGVPISSGWATHGYSSWHSKIAPAGYGCPPETRGSRTCLGPSPPRSRRA